MPSRPIQAKAIVAQKATSARRNPGTIVCRLIAVAGPKRHQLASARTTSRIVPSQRATAPALLSQVARLSPRTLSVAATTRAAIEKAMKYRGEALATASALPDQNNALPAAKYSSAGK